DLEARNGLVGLDAPEGAQGRAGRRRGSDHALRPGDLDRAGAITEIRDQVGTDGRDVAAGKRDDEGVAEEVLDEDHRRRAKRALPQQRELARRDTSIVRRAASELHAGPDRAGREAGVAAGPL